MTTNATIKCSICGAPFPNEQQKLAHLMSGHTLPVTIVDERSPILIRLDAIEKRVSAMELEVVYLTGLIQGLAARGQRRNPNPIDVEGPREFTG